MSEENNGLCRICGGALRIAYTTTFEQCRPCEIKVSEVPPGFVRLCPGHFPEQDRQHDGHLDKDKEGRVQYGALYPGEQGIYIRSGVDDSVYLNPPQALSLLTWLLQERRQLEEIAAQVEQTKEK